MKYARERLQFVALALVTIGLGLAIHAGAVTESRVARDVLGDAVWAMMIAWWVGALLPDMRIVPRALTALAICWCVELSQLHHSPGVDRLRGTMLGALVLGSGFDPRDLFAYAAGVGVAVVIELAFLRRLRSD